MLTEAIEQAAKDAIREGALPEGELPQVILEVPPQKEFGDFATNFAMQSARVFHRNPRQIAEELAKRIEGDWLDHTQIAGPGFLNFYLKGNVLYDSFQKILEAGESFGNLPKLDHPKIQVEYVSANPTGLLHVGHGRGAAGQTKWRMQAASSSTARLQRPVRPSTPGTSSRSLSATVPSRCGCSRMWSPARKTLPARCTR